MDDRDVDYLNHLEVEVPDEVAMEGILKAAHGDAVGGFHNLSSEIKGMFLGIEAKRKYIEQICINLNDWLKEKQDKYPNLDKKAFETGVEAAEALKWRYYFLLNDATWNKIEADLKNNKITQLEKAYDISFNERNKMINQLNKIDNISDLVKIVEKYQERSNKFFEQIIKRQAKIKMFPFQLILMGATDLRITVKKIVNLAT